MTELNINNDKVLLVANVPSMIDMFNRDNISILLNMGYKLCVACNFNNASNYSADRTEKLKHDLDELGVEHIDLPVPRSVTKVFDLIPAINILKNWLKNNPCKLIHCQSPFGGVVARLAAKPFRKNGTKVLYYAHGFHFFKGASIINWALYYNMEKYLAKYTDVIVTINKEDYNTAKCKLKADKVTYIPGVGINTKRISGVVADKEKKCAELGISSDKKIILKVAELAKGKNIEAAIEIFSKIKYTDSVLVVCGKGKLLNELKAAAKKFNVADRVFLLGYRTDIFEFCKISDLFLFTSKREGLPVAVMEAMAAGLPVVCSDIRGNSDLIENDKGGYIVKLPNIEEFAAKTDIILADESKRKAMGEYNMSLASGKLDISNIGKMMKDLYTTMLESGL